MDLKEFLSETLVQLVEGVKDAQARTKDKKARINPRLIANSNTEKVGVFDTDRGVAPAQLVQADVALTTIGVKTIQNVGFIPQ